MQHTRGDAAQNKADKAHVDDLERAADHAGGKTPKTLGFLKPKTRLAF